MMNQQKTLIIGLVLGVLYYAMVFNDGSALEVQIKDVQAKIVEQEAIKVKTEQAVREAEQVRANVAALSEQFKLVTAKLPNEVAMSDIIKDVDGVSRASGVSIKLKEPLAVANKDFYEEIPVKLRIEGTYSEITMFLYYLSAMERIMRVKSFGITESRPMQTSSNARPTGRVNFEGEILAFRFLGEKKP